jgi:hypothetical protein
MVVSIIVDNAPAAGFEDAATRWILRRLSKSPDLRAERAGRPARSIRCYRTATERRPFPDHLAVLGA